MKKVTVTLALGALFTLAPSLVLFLATGVAILALQASALAGLHTPDTGRPAPAAG